MAVTTLGGTTLEGVYTATQYNNGDTPRVGSIYEDPATPKRYIFLKNTGATSIAASMVATSLTTSPASYACEIATTNEQPFAGARIAGATTVAQNEYGWFLIAGNVTLIAGTAGVTAGDWIATGAGADGSVEDAADDYIGSRAKFGLAQATAADTVTFAATVSDNLWGA